AVVVTRDEELRWAERARGKHPNILVWRGRKTSDRSHAPRTSGAVECRGRATRGGRERPRYRRSSRLITPAPVPTTARAVGAQNAYIHLRPLFTSARPVASSVLSPAMRVRMRQPALPFRVQFREAA